MQSMSQVLKQSYLPLGVALIRLYTSTTFQRSSSSLIPSIRPIKSLILQHIHIKSHQLLSYQIFEFSSTVMLTTPLNSGNVPVVSIGNFMIKLTKKPRLLISHLSYRAKIHGILARKMKVMTF